MADDEVLIKIAADIASAVEGLSTLTEKMSEVVGQITDVGAKSEEAEGATKSFWETWVGGAENGTTASVLWGEQMSQAFDTLKEGVGNAIKALPNLVANSAAVGDELFTMSNRLNIAVGSIGELEYIAGQSGASMQGMARTIQTLGTSLSDVEGKSAKAISALGLSVSDLKKQKPEEAFYQILDAIKQTVPVADQSAKAMEIFGGRFRANTMLLKEDIAGLRASYKQLGMAGEDLNKLAVEGDRYSDNLKNIQLVQDSWKNSIANALLPTINDLLETMPGLGGAVLTLGEGFMSTASSVLPLLGNVALLKGSGLATWAMEAASAIPGVTTAATALKGSLGFLGSAVAVVGVAFAAWEIGKWISNLQLFSGELKTMSQWVEYAGAKTLQFFGIAEKTSDADLKLAISSRAAGEAHKDQAKATAEVGAAAVKAVDGFAQLNAATAKTKAEYDALLPTQRASIKAAIEQGVSLKDIHDATQISTDALTLFKQEMEKAKKVSDSGPLGKFLKEVTDMAPAMKAALASGANMSLVVEQFGKAADDVVKKATLIPGALEKVPVEVRKIADEFQKAELAKVMEGIHKKTIELAAAFQEKLRKAAEETMKAINASVLAAYTNIVKIDDALAISAKTGSEKRLAIIAKAQQDEENIAKGRYGVSDALREKELDAIKRKYDEQRALSEKYTGDVVRDAELRGIKTKAEAEKELAVEQKVLADMLAARGEFTYKDIEKQKETVKSAEVAAGKMKVDWGTALDSINASFTQMATIAGGSFGGILKGVAEVSSGLGVMKSSFGSAIGMFKGAGGLGGIAGSFKNLSGGVGGLIGGITKGLGTVMPMAGAIIAGVGSAIKVGKKLFDVFNKSAGEKAAKEVGKNFGTTITEEAGNAIAKTAKDMFKGDRFAASIYEMNSIIQTAGGITEKNFSQMTARLRDVFSMVETGKFTVEQATKVLEENFGAFADYVTSSGKVASKEFTDIIALNAKFGTQSKQVMDFVAGQTSRLGGALAKMAGSMDENAESVARFERLAVAGFNAAISAGVPYLDAIDQMGPALDKISEKNKKLGLAGGAAIQELLKFREVVNANKDLVESAGALNEVMLALSNTGALNAETMADLEAQGSSTFAQLTAAGFTEQQALQQMKGYLENVRDAHERLGLPIDENTQKMLDQATASGVLKEQEMSTNDVMMQGLGAIIKALGGDLPASFKKMTDSAVASANTVAGSMTGTVGGAVKATSDQIKATPWQEYATKGVAAGNITSSAVNKTANAVDAVGNQLENTDWSGWADELVSAANAAQEAVDGVSLGHSPGGLKEIPLKIKDAMAAFKDFEHIGVGSAEEVQKSVDALSSAHANIGIAGDAAGGAATAGGGGGGETFHITIQALDSAGVDGLTETKLIPAIVKALRKGGRNLSDVQGVIQ